jgi:hypothetical protein
LYAKYSHTAFELKILFFESDAVCFVIVKKRGA